MDTAVANLGPRAYGTAIRISDRDPLLFRLIVPSYTGKSASYTIPTILRCDRIGSPILARLLAAVAHRPRAYRPSHSRTFYDPCVSVHTNSCQQQTRLLRATLPYLPFLIAHSDIANVAYLSFQTTSSHQSPPLTQAARQVFRLWRLS